MRYTLFLALAVCCFGEVLCHADEPAGPVKVLPRRFYPVLMPDGATWGVSVEAIAEGRLGVFATVSPDGGHTWGERRLLAELPKVEPPTTVWGDGVPLIARDGTFHYFVLKWDQSDKSAPRAKLNLWHLKSPPPYETWTEPKMIFDGYIGALLSAFEMPSGLIASPFAYMTDRHYSKEMPGLMSWVYMGEHTTTSVHSQDGGDTFQESPTPVNLPASIIIGNENGAIEPVCQLLKDGRVWMLIRTQRGRMWESYSTDGISWSPAQPSRFIGSDSPAGITRLKDGRIVTMWNCCQRYPYAHGGRQVLHAAISDDEGVTWNGFREVVRDPRRLEPAHPIKGDYGTAYPILAPTADGNLVFATGQGPSTGVFVLDPDWLTQTEQVEDFSNGLENWSAYGTKGVELVDHPDKQGAKALRIEGIDHEFPAGATWNFPNGRRGTLNLRVQALPGESPTAVALTDHYSSPFDVEGESAGLFAFGVSAAADAGLSSGWHDLELSWDTNARTCTVSIDGKPRKELPQLRLVTEGACYLRLRSTGHAPGSGGLLVESVSAKVELTGSGLSPTELP